MTTRQRPAVAAGRWLEVGAESNSRSRDGYSACKSGDVLIHVGAVWRSHNSPGNSRRARVAADVPAFLGPVRLTSRVLILFTVTDFLAETSSTYRRRADDSR